MVTRSKVGARLRRRWLLVSVVALLGGIGVGLGAPASAAAPTLVYVSVTGEVVAHTQVLFQGEVTLPDGQVRVLQGVSCPVLDDQSVYSLSLPYGTYNVYAHDCTADLIDSGTYQPYVVAGTLTSSSFGITTVALPDGRVRALYSAKLSALGGTQYAWNVVSGTLPPGLKLAATGQLSGIPTVPGTYPFTVQVTSGAATETWPYQITISPTSVVPLSIRSVWLPPSLHIGKAFSQTLQAAGGTAPLHWKVTAGGMPTGLTLSSAGTVSGRPQYYEWDQFIVTVTDSSTPATSVSRQFSLYVNPITITTPYNPKPATVGGFYDLKLTTDSGDAPLLWSYAGQLAPGLTYSRNGTISGIPTAAGTYYAGVGVYDAHDNTAGALVTITVNR